MAKQTYTTIAEKLRTNKGRLSNLVVLGTLVYGATVNRRGIDKLLITYCRGEFDPADRKTIGDQFYARINELPKDKNKLI